MRTLPDTESIIQLHRKYAPHQNAFELIYTHSQIVWKLAEQLIASAHLKVDADFIRAACLLHDIGAYRLFLPTGEIDDKNYIKHGVLGYDLLASEGFDESLCRVASCHTGVGFTAQEVVDEGLPIPPADYMAKTTEERLIMYADKFHTKASPPTFMTAGTYASQAAEFGKKARFQLLVDEFGEPNLKPLAAEFGLAIV
jgi:uncharacterized protein